MGTPLKRRVRWCALCLPLMLVATMAGAGEHYAIVITGASGGEQYARKYDAWRMSFVALLRDKFGFDDRRLVVLADHEGDAVALATRENIQRSFTDLRKRIVKDDLLFVLLMGHGTSLDGEDAKFNLVGPDLSSTEWAELLRPIQGRIAFVNTTGASFPFMRKLAGRGRVILTATDSAAQRFETVFPEFFLKAFDDPAADLDKNGRVSLWEAFAYASDGVRQWYEQHGQLPTERALLDDNGDGIGREAEAPGPGGAVARITYLEPDATARATGDRALDALLKRQLDLESQVEALKARKSAMSPELYDVELERVLVELARVSLQIRTKS